MLAGVCRDITSGAPSYKGEIIATLRLDLSPYGVHGTRQILDHIRSSMKVRDRGETPRTSICLLSTQPQYLQGESIELGLGSAESLALQRQASPQDFHRPWNERSGVYVGFPSTSEERSMISLYAGRPEILVELNMCGLLHGDTERHRTKEVSHSCEMFGMGP
jgi:hypothetical protein